MTGFHFLPYWIYVDSSGTTHIIEMQEFTGIGNAVQKCISVCTFTG